MTVTLTVDREIGGEGKELRPCFSYKTCGLKDGVDQKSFKEMIY